MALDWLHTVDRQADRTRWGLISSVPFDLFFVMKIIEGWNLWCDLSPALHVQDCSQLMFICWVSGLALIEIEYSTARIYDMILTLPVALREVRLAGLVGTWGGVPFGRRMGI